MLRVVVRHAPNLYAIVGLAEDADCPQTLAQTASDGSPHTFFRVHSTPRWVLYHEAMADGGGHTFDKAQQ
jgi:hypothetical protein